MSDYKYAAVWLEKIADCCRDKSPLCSAEITRYVATINCGEENLRLAVSALREVESVRTLDESNHERISALQKAFALACRFLGDQGVCPAVEADANFPECNGEMDECGNYGLWNCWQKYFRERVAAEQVCRVCGCTQQNACPGGCSWVEEDLCSSCTDKAAEMEHQPIRPERICLCGSTRFYDAYQQANYELTMAGKIVLTVGFYPHSPKQAHGQTVGCTPEQKVKLDELHKRKIDLCDRVLVLNVGGYIGNSTRGEITYAMEHGKPVDYLEALHDA